MYRVKEVYELHEETAYYIISNENNIDIRIDTDDLDALINKGMVSNARKEGNEIRVYGALVLETDNLIPLYHVSMTEPLEKIYLPRVPSSASVEEDQVTERFCLSTSIEGCLTALNMQTKDLAEAILNKPIYLLKTFTAENDPRLLTPEFLYDRGLVLDTPVTGEHWYTGAIVPKVEKIQVIDFMDDFKNVASEKDRKAVYKALREAGVTEDILKDMNNYSVTDLVNFKVKKYKKYLSSNSELDLAEVIYCALIVKDVEYRVIA